MNPRKRRRAKRRLRALRRVRSYAGWMGDNFIGPVRLTPGGRWTATLRKPLERIHIAVELPALPPADS